ncbi:MAG: hypothetical protein R2705_00190 [Ilumatobacteraceae bacterium]
MNRARVLVAVATWVVLVVALALGGYRPATLALAGIVGAAVVGVALIGDVWTDVVPIDWERRRRSLDLHAIDTKANRLRVDVRAAMMTGSTQLTDQLTELVDDRLLAHHGVDRASDPASADALLTPRLRRLVEGSNRRTVLLRELSQVVTEIEAL